MSILGRRCLSAGRRLVRRRFIRRGRINWGIWGLWLGRKLTKCCLERLADGLMFVVGGGSTLCSHTMLASSGLRLAMAVRHTTNTVHMLFYSKIRARLKPVAKTTLHIVFCKTTKASSGLRPQRRRAEILSESFVATVSTACGVQRLV